MAKKKKPPLFKVIASRHEALETINDSSVALLFLAALQGGIGYVYRPGLVIDAVILAALAAYLRWHKSRIVACLLLLMAIGMTITTVLSLLKIAEVGGHNISVALLMCWIAGKAVEATFKLHGKYSKSEGRVRGYRNFVGVPILRSVGSFKKSG